MTSEPLTSTSEALLAGPSPCAAPLAVLTVNGFGVVEFWGSGARRLFGLEAEEAVGTPAAAILPVTVVLEGFGDGDFPLAYGEPPAPPRMPEPSSGRFWGSGAGPGDVVWWAWPLTGPGLQRLVIIAADGGGLQRHCAGAPILAAFDARDTLPDRVERVRLLRSLLPRLGAAERDDIIEQMLVHGYPVLETAPGRRVPVTPLPTEPYLPSQGRTA